MEGGRKRPSRATSRPPSEFTASANAANGAGSSDDEDYEGGHQVGCHRALWHSAGAVPQARYSQAPTVPVPQRASSRRQPKVDFTKLEVCLLCLGIRLALATLYGLRVLSCADNQSQEV